MRYLEIALLSSRTSPSLVSLFLLQNIPSPYFPAPRLDVLTHFPQSFFFLSSSSLPQTTSHLLPHRRLCTTRWKFFFRQAECRSEVFGIHFCFWSLASRLSSPSTSQLFYLPLPLLVTSYVVFSRHNWESLFLLYTLFRTGKRLLDTHFPTMRHIPYLLSIVVPATTRSPPFIEQRKERTKKRCNEESQDKTYPLMGGSLGLLLKLRFTKNHCMK